MTTHVRQQIAVAITAAVTGLATTGTRVTRSRIYPTESTELPCLRVRYASGTESSQPRSLPAPRVFERVCRVEVAAYATDSTDVETALNAICVEVEKALAMPTLAGPWMTLTLVGTDIQSSGEGDVPLGEAVMTYQALYHTRETTPETLA